MTRIFTLIFLLSLFACKSSKDYLERSDADKALQDAVKKLNKSDVDGKAEEAIPVLYKNISTARLSNIKNYQGLKDLSKWDKIIKEFLALQDAYNIIVESPAALRLVTPKNYTAEIEDSRHNAAVDYYEQAITYLNKTGRNNAKKAYTHFKKADKYEPGFRDANNQARKAYEKAVVNVVINPIQDNSYFFNSGWGNTGYNFSNEYFQQNLVRDLRYYEDRYAAKFFTDWEARRENVKPDWTIDIRLRNLDIPQPTGYTYKKNASARVEIGRDTANQPVYRTVYATVNVNRLSFVARADMQVIIEDLVTGKNILNNSYRDDYRWQNETATYSGDSRALSAADWQMINNGYYNTPTKDDILKELYKKLYPQIKNNIGYAVEW